MNCPNCNQPFTLRYDYARHLQDCRPSDARAATIERGLRGPADDLFVEILADPPPPADERDVAATPRSG